MSYYSARVNAFRRLEAMIKSAGGDGVDPLLLKYSLTCEYEIGDKAIEKRLDLLKELGKIQEIGGSLIWLKLQNSAEK